MCSTARPYDICPWRAGGLYGENGTEQEPRELAFFLLLLPLKPGAVFPGPLPHALPCSLQGPTSAPALCQPLFPGAGGQSLGDSRAPGCARTDGISAGLCLRHSAVYLEQGHRAPPNLRGSPGGQ